MDIAFLKKGRGGRIVVIGLGYVGLPLAVLLGKKFNVIGYDVSSERVEELRKGFDRTGEVDAEELKAGAVEFVYDPFAISDGDVVIVTVPTPVDEHKIPDLGPLLSATATVGRYMKKGSIVVYESTVYPGVTEEKCVPVLEEKSGLKWKEDFHVGYSPERINPGDEEHTVSKITKVVSGDTADVAEFIEQIYGSVIEAGVYRVSSIRVAEAAKVIENIQRDINIALMNELSILFHRMGIDTKEVLRAAKTKWNFLPFEPGLVGGHCIPVDPYYLTYKAQEIGYYPEVVLAGRRVNDSMGRYVAIETVRLLVQNGMVVKDSKVLVLGVSFKENVPDVRNSRVFELVRELEGFGCDVYVYDPVVGEKKIKVMGLKAVSDPFTDVHDYGAVVLAVPHRIFLTDQLTEVKKLFEKGVRVFVDVKGVLGEGVPECVTYWRL